MNKKDGVDRIVQQFQQLQDANKRSFTSKLNAKCKKYKVEYDKLDLEGTILRVAQEMATQKCFSL